MISGHIIVDPTSGVVAVHNCSAEHQPCAIVNTPSPKPYRRSTAKQPFFPMPTGCSIKIIFQRFYDSYTDCAKVTLGVPSSDAILHCLLLLNTCPICLRKFHICQSDTRATDRNQNRRSNSIWFWGLDPQLVATLPECAPKPRPSLKCSGFCGLPE